MSDDTPDQAPDDSATPEATPEATPAAKPRSAASRARRIGGAAAEAARPTPSAKPVGLDKEPAAKGKGDKASEKPTEKPAKKPGKAAKAAAVASGDGGGDGDKAGVTISLPSWLVWVPAVAFAAVAVVFLALFAVDQSGGDDTPTATSDKTRQEVLAAAKTCLAALNTYRYDQLPQAEAAGTKCTTGQLTTEYKRTVSTVLQRNAPKLKAVQIAKINTAGIESVTANGKQWTVLVYGQLNITTANTGKQGRVDPFASSARLQQVNGKWVLSKIDTVSSFSS